jgi:DNA-binding beta-propeller fold protein YncE
MATETNKHLRSWAAAFACLFALCLLAAPTAWGADRVYWANFDGNPPTIQWANLDGSGTGTVPTLGAPLDGPMGLAIDSARGRIYWTNYGEAPFGSGDGNGSTIGWANLDGSGAGQFMTTATVAGPHGPAIDPATQKIYWPNDSMTYEIAFSNLDGTGGGTLPTGTASLISPRGPAVDPATGRLYWANHDGNLISYANLDGSGGADLPIDPAEVQMPEGIAVDNAANRIYWGNFADDTRPVAYANLDGSGAGHLNPAGASTGVAHGIALDAAGGKIYWANYDRDLISYVNLDGSGGADLNTPGANIHGPALPIIQKQPTATAAPNVGGGDRIGSRLSCSQAKWAPDLVEAQLYRAPQSIAYQWTQKGKPVQGATAKTLHIRAIGEYRCVATAANAAGSTASASKAESVFKVGRVHRNTRKGNAVLLVKLPASGKLSLSGGGVAKRIGVDARTLKRFSRHVRAGKVKVPITAKGKAKGRLNRRGSARLKVHIAFDASGGPPATQTIKVTLLKKLHG